MRFALAPRSPRPSRDFERTSTRAPDPSSRTRTVTSSTKRKSAVVVVGHQPDLGRTAAFLLSGSEAPWSLKKGGAWWLSSRTREDAAQVVLRAVVAPDFV